MDIWHRLGRIIRVSNLGTLIFFLLNIALLYVIFFPSGITSQHVGIIVACYTASILISFSPVGEWLYSVFAGAKEIKRKDIQIRLIPLLEVVLEQAKDHRPQPVDSVKLKIIYDKSPNAFAIGRKTICVTDGLLDLSDDEIMAVFAHELGHLAYKHSALQLLIGGGNLLISGCLLIVKLVCWIITAVFAGVAIGGRRLGRGLLLTFIGMLPAVLLWMWTKFCLLFLRWSMRQNEYVADRYAYELGYGSTLAFVLDHRMYIQPENSLLKALFATHPKSDDRIAKLQDYGVEYSRY